VNVGAMGYRLRGLCIDNKESQINVGQCIKWRATQPMCRTKKSGRDNKD